MTKKIDITYLILIVLLIATCLVSWKLYFQVYTKKDDVSIHGFPKTIGNWTSEEVEITEKEYAILETRNTFARHYSLPNGQEVNLFIVYSQNNRKVAHPPEVCYTGGGTTVVSKKSDAFSMPLEFQDNQETVPMTSMIMDSINMQQVVMYTFKVGSNFTASYWHQQLLIAIKTLLGRPSGSALVRVSAVIVDGDAAAVEESLKGFTKTITPFLYKYLP